MESSCPMRIDKWNSPLMVLVILELLICAIGGREVTAQTIEVVFNFVDQLLSDYIPTKSMLELLQNIL